MSNLYGYIPPPEWYTTNTGGVSMQRYIALAYIWITYSPHFPPLTAQYPRCKALVIRRRLSLGVWIGLTFTFFTEWIPMDYIHLLVFK